MDSDTSMDKSLELRYSKNILQIVTEAFAFAAGQSYHTLFLFPMIEKGETNWGFLIVTRRVDEERLELAAYSFEFDGQGSLSKRLESRKARLPEEKLDEVLESLIQRMDELESNYREVNLCGLGEPQAQLEYLQKLLLGEQDGAESDPSVHLQPGESPEHRPYSGDRGSEPQHDV